MEILDLLFWVPSFGGRGKLVHIIQVGDEENMGPGGPTVKDDPFWKGDWMGPSFGESRIGVDTPIPVPITKFTFEKERMGGIRIGGMIGMLTEVNDLTRTEERGFLGLSFPEGIPFLF